MINIVVSTINILSRNFLQEFFVHRCCNQIKVGNLDLFRFILMSELNMIIDN